MKKALLLAASVSALSFASSANAATLVSAAVFGSVNGTVWATAGAPGTVAGNYTLFLQNPGLGNFLNPNDEAITLPVQPGNNYAFLAGEGYFPGQTADSDPSYNLRLTFDNGAILNGAYTPLTNTFLGGAPVTVGGQTLTLTEFSFRRNLGNTVGPFLAQPQTGEGNDYAGNFSFSASAAPAVPEPTTWAMMLFGFGAVGFGMRRRRSQGSQTARVRFAI